MIEIKFTQCKDIIPPEQFEGGFCAYMLRLLRKKNGGWLYGDLMPRGEVGILPEALPISTAACETVRAVVTEDNKCSVLRLDSHLARLDVQAKKMGLPAIDSELTSYGIRQLLSLLRPYLAGGELFIHINLVSCDTDIFNYPAQEAVLTVTVEKREKSQPRSVSAVISAECPLSCCDRYARPAGFAVREGLYEAKQRGFDTVMWLDRKYDSYIESLSGMDVFFRIGDGVYHAGGGIYADSIVKLIDGWAIPVYPGRVSCDFLKKEYREGRVQEVFAVSAVTGVVSVSRIDLGDITLEFDRAKLAKKLYDTINSIIYCDHPDAYNWITKI